ncbi:MAG: hisS [Candidatus Saccharibacteria bacterium]|nr:hisS [Candidatus Saccharibacteria bacterium]
MALSTKPYKGARDFYPEDKRLQTYLFSTIRKTVAKFGYEEYDAPILEPLELYLAKTGDEIVNEQTYVFTDRGDREVVIRPEMTPTVSRMVAARRQELPFPVRWFSIPNLWRYERPQRGRLREHWQLNVDLFGVAGLEAEHELIVVVDEIFKAFKAKHDMYEIKLNNRKLVDHFLLDYLGLDSVQAHSVGKLIDRKNKMSEAMFEAQADAILTPSQREAGVLNKLLGVMKIKKLSHLPEDLREHDSAKDLQKMLDLLAASGITNAHYDPTLMRGFDYYTGIVFEVFDTNPENNRAMLGGGRYDGLVGLFGVEPVPTVGFGWGDVTLQNFLETHELLPPKKTPVDVYVVMLDLNLYEKAQKTIASLRSMGMNVAVDMTGRKADKQIKSADKQAIAFALFIGAKELEEGVFNLKNLHTGHEEAHSIERIVTMIKDHRRK